MMEGEIGWRRLLEMWRRRVPETPEATRRGGRDEEQDQANRLLCEDGQGRAKSHVSRHD